MMRLEGWHVLVILGLLVAVVVAIAVILIVGLVMRTLASRNDDQDPGAFRQ
ncbi:hypothetical protein [Paenarthrobacter sp. A20]|uniref:hypothetical protein n=1 Tax=Paenarthrobacter sp. A20 TaxID=2817891 RepID=UPI00209D33BA|nr:hypothetical protein [Paenarthrobacter sp. A20]MCP1411757.1 nitrogen fixation protein FixH [Paenarthrobacter sp. A20]